MSTPKFVFILLWLAGSAFAQVEPEHSGPEHTEHSELEHNKAAGGVAESEEALNWSGNWRSFWRGGQALLVIRQDGHDITGTYEPGEGKITGTFDGLLVKGTWTQPGNEGSFEFALAPDGESFVGRFGNGEYWNGERLDDGHVFASGFGTATPQAALASLMTAANAAAAGDSVAELAIRRYLVFDGGATALRERNGRIAQLLRLIDLSTFRVLDAPETGASGRAIFAMGPDGADWTFPLEFRATRDGQWSVVVPALETLGDRNAAALAALGVTSFDELAEKRRFSPRQAMRDFVGGTEEWGDGGDKRALATLDLSDIPEKLRAIDGPLSAEYIRQIINRLGKIVWQEIPDDPDRRQPYVAYEHALGDIAIAPFPQENGTVKWLFTADSVAAAPAIYEAMQNLPMAEGVAESAPLTRAFGLRSELKEVSPRLLNRAFLLENWQWIAVVAALLIMLLASWVVARILGAACRGLLRLRGARPEMQSALASAFGWPARFFTAGAILTLLLREIGLRRDVSAIGNGLAAMLLLLGGTFFLYRLVNAFTVWTVRPAANTATKVDDIAVALGGGLAKVAVLVGGVMLGAEVLGLPYEGVIAGLGVGGLALAIASKDAVSNFIGAGILVSDRPFKKGDLIEGGGLKGIVEEVGMRSTRLRTMDGTVVVVPNVKLSDGTVNNWGRSKDRPQPFDLSIGAAFDTPRSKLDAFVGRLREAFIAQPNARPGVSVALDQIGPSSLGIKLSGSFEAAADMVAAKHKLLGDIVELANEMGVEFAVPTSKVHYVGPAASVESSIGIGARTAAE